MQNNPEPASPRPAQSDVPRHPSAASTSSSDNPHSTPTTPPSRNPGDDAVAGTTGTGEDVCTRCEGTGKLDGGRDCPDCDGSGVIIQGIGGG